MFNRTSTSFAGSRLLTRALAVTAQARIRYNEPMPSSSIVNIESPYTFSDTVQRLLAAFAAKRIKVFAVIDQQAEASAVGLAMPPTTLVIFGNPQAGTPLMLANPEVGVDLPLKVLVSEATPERVVVCFTSATTIIQRHGLPPELAANLAAAERVIEAALGRSVGA